MKTNLKEILHLSGHSLKLSITHGQKFSLIFPRIALCFSSFLYTYQQTDQLVTLYFSVKGKYQTELTKSSFRRYLCIAGLRKANNIYTCEFTFVSLSGNHPNGSRCTEFCSPLIYISFLHCLYFYFIVRMQILSVTFIPFFQKSYIRGIKAWINLIILSTLLFRNSCEKRTSSPVSHR